MENFEGALERSAMLLEGHEFGIIPWLYGYADNKTYITKTEVTLLSLSHELFMQFMKESINIPKSKFKSKTPIETIN